MNQQSLASFSKISVQMDRLSLLINKEQLMTQQIQQLLNHRDRHSESSNSNSENIDLYFKQYDNPTTKSIPFDPDLDPSSQMLDEQSQTINTIYRNKLPEDSEDEDKDNLHDDKSTVILAGLKSQLAKEKEDLSLFPIDNAIPNYSSVNMEGANKRQLPSKVKKGNAKQPTTSMPSEIFIVKENQKFQGNIVKNNSVSKPTAKTESPVLFHSKNKKLNNEAEYQNSNLLKELKGKLSKINKLDREELNKLQEKKVQKKNEPSSHRKKTKRELGNGKSTISIVNHSTKLSTSATNYLTHKTFSNTSCKKIDKAKKETPKREEKVLLNHQDWQRIQKNSKKLNRVNIYKLQQNLKKGNEKRANKDVSITKLQKKGKANQKYSSHHKEHHQLKLHFTEGDDESCMKKLIQEKQLDKQYQKETEKYLQVVKKMSKPYFQSLMKQCRETSEEAVLKLKLVTLILYFFDQFTSNSLLSNNHEPKNEDFFRRVAQQEIIEVLLHPKQILKVTQSLPSILMNDNVISAERINIFNSKFSEINQQLDQQLEFFLIKKSTLYAFIHSLYEYITFLVQKDLVAQTKRTKIAPVEHQQGLYGYYSSRSKKEDLAHKYIKKNGGGGGSKPGYRCDSDRKMTVEDEQLCFNDIQKLRRKESSMPSMKVNLLKRPFK